MQILLIDDHVLFRDGLKYLLSNLDKNLIFLEAGNCENALALESLDDTALVLLDLTLPGVSGMGALHQVKKFIRDAAVVVLSSDDDPQTIRAAIDAGAAGFIPKSSTQDVLIAALKLVMAGGVYLPPDLLAGASAPTPHREDEPISQLSKRQREVLMSAVQGKPNKVIARDLDISTATVKAHMAASFRTLGVNNRIEAFYAVANTETATK